MRDLRKKILTESKKTLSRKAQTKQESARSSAGYTPTTSSRASPATSRASSRPASRHASEDEEGPSDSEYDDTNLSSDDQLDTRLGMSWADRLQSRLDELKDRKLGIQDREDALVGYVNLLCRHFVSEDDMSNFAPDLISAFSKSITAGISAKERLFAVKAIIVTSLTYPSQTVFDHVSQTLKGLCYGAEDETVKAEAIHALSVTVLYGGGLATAYKEMLDFFTDIIESDGAAADAEDSGLVVTAALQAWALVATYVEDLAEDCEQAMEMCMDQLDSTDVNVQTSAGSNIALLFEAARDYEKETGMPLSLEYNQHRIMTRMSEIVKLSPKATSRKDRRHLRTNFSSVITSLERGLGPGYSTAGRGAANPNTGGRKTEGEGEFQEFGYREKLRVYDQLIIVDTWALQARVQALKTHLGSGFGVHFMENPAVEEILESAHVEQVKGPRDAGDKRRKQGRYSVRDIEGGGSPRSRESRRDTEE